MNEFISWYDISMYQILMSYIMEGKPEVIFHTEQDYKNWDID